MPRMMYPVIDGWKRCTKCGTNKPFTSEFYPVHKNRPCGLGSVCRACVRGMDKKWRQNNPETAKASAEAWRKANPERARVLRSAWNAANPEKARASSRASGRKWRLTHPEAAKTRAAVYRASRKERDRVCHKAWKAAHGNAVRAYEHKRRARKLQSSGSHTEADVLRILAQQSWRCFYCQCDIRDAHHIEHRVPLSRGGSNGPENIVCSCPSCNFRKHAKTEVEFIWNTPRRRVQSVRRVERVTTQVALPVEGV